LIEVEVKPDKSSQRRLVRKFAQVQHDLKDARPANRRAGIWLMRWINQNFRSQGGHTGRKWDRLKRGGRWQKGVGLDTTAKLLQDTGRLRASFDFKATQKTVIVGSDLSYSLYHEEGLPMRNLPKRRMLPEVNDQAVSTALYGIYAGYLEKVTKK